jgi:hypothetical protein
MSYSASYGPEKYNEFSGINANGMNGGPFTSDNSNALIGCTGLPHRGGKKKHAMKKIKGGYLAMMSDKQNPIGNYPISITNSRIIGGKYKKKSTSKKHLNKSKHRHTLKCCHKKNKKTAYKNKRSKKTKKNKIKQRGGYHQYLNNTPYGSSGYEIGNVNLEPNESALANGYFKPISTC